MMSGVRSPRGLIGAGLTVLVLALASGCSGGDEHASDHTSGLPSSTQLAGYFDAVASYDHDKLAAAAKIAADGSPAQAYAAYLAEYSASAVAAGQPVDPARAKAVDGGYQACGGTGAADECVTWADLEGEDGKLTDFTVAGIRLDDSLVDLTAQPPITSTGLYTVQPDHAYRSPQSGTLFVLVTVTAGDAPVSPEQAIYIEPAVSLKSVATRAPATVPAGSSTPVVLAFPHAEKAALTGSVTLALRVGTSSESVGFDLAAS